VLACLLAIYFLVALVMPMKMLDLKKMSVMPSFLFVCSVDVDIKLVIV